MRISDYLFAKDRLFAELNLDAEELKLYDQIADKLCVEPPTPDLVIYLQASVDALLQRIARRGIGHERLIDCLLEEPEVLMRLHVDPQRLCAAYRKD